MQCPSCGGIIKEGRCVDCTFSVRSGRVPQKMAQVDIAPGLKLNVDVGNPDLQAVGQKLAKAQAQVGAVLEECDAVRQRAEQLLPAVEELGQLALEAGAKLKRFLRGAP